MLKQNIILFLLDKLRDRLQSKTETRNRVKVDVQQKITVVVVNITGNER